MPEDSHIGVRRKAARAQETDAYAVRRREIADAAARVFKARGYGQTNLSDIAAEVGVDRASLYYYFSSKGELFDELISGVVVNNTLIAERIACSDLPAADKLQALIVQLMESFADNYPLLYVYLQEDMSHVAGERRAWAKEMRAVNRRYENAIISIAESGMESGVFAPVGDPRVVAFGIMGMVSWTYRWFRPEDEEQSATAIGTTYAEIILNGLATSSEFRG